MRTNFKKIFFITFFIIVFFMWSSLNWELSFIHLKLFTGSFYDIAQLYKLSHLNGFFFQCSIFILIFHVFVISFCISINRVTYSSFNTFFCHYNISLSVQRFNFTLVIFKRLFLVFTLLFFSCHDHPSAEGDFAGSSSYILRQIFIKFANTTANNNVSLWTYKFWYSPNFLLKNLYKLFLLECNLHK